MAQLESLRRTSIGNDLLQPQFPNSTQRCELNRCCIINASSPSPLKWGRMYLKAGLHRGQRIPNVGSEGFHSLGNVPVVPARAITTWGSRKAFNPCHAKYNWFGGRVPEDEGEGRLPVKSTRKDAVKNGLKKTECQVLERWDIPWDGKVTSLGMVAWLTSFLLTGLFISVVAAQIGIGRRQLLNYEDQALYVFFNQLAQTIAGLTVVNYAVKPYRPLSDDLLSIAWDSPFDLKRGWILWSSIGIVCSCGAVVVASYISNSINGEPLARDEADALVQLMPIIGASPLSTLSLIGVTGVLAPILEETIFRGFLMTSLTKWVPTPVAVLLSSAMFAGVHLTPGEFFQLFALGTILGFSYAQTRNLLTPILIHSMWNSGVVVILTLLRLQGYDLKELI